MKSAVRWGGELMITPDPDEATNASQLAAAPPLLAAQVHDHGPLPETVDAVPVVQSPAVGLTVRLSPFDVPQTPPVGVAVGVGVAGLGVGLGGAGVAVGAGGVSVGVATTGVGAGVGGFGVGVGAPLLTVTFSVALPTRTPFR